MIIIQKSDRANDLVRRAFALDTRRRNEQMHRPRASRNHIDDIANRGATGRSNYADSSRKERNWPLQLLREKALPLQTGLCLLERELQRAGADWLKSFNHELISALLFVHAQASAQQGTYQLVVEALE